MQIKLLVLTFQAGVETGADPGIKIIWHQSSQENHETGMSGQFQHKNEQVLINVVAKNNLNNTLPFFHGLACLTSRFYHMLVCNMAEINSSELEDCWRLRDSMSGRKSLLPPPALVWTTNPQLMLKYKISNLWYVSSSLGYTVYISQIW